MTILWWLHAVHGKEEADVEEEPRRRSGSWLGFTYRGGGREEGKDKRREELSEKLQTFGATWNPFTREAIRLARRCAYVRRRGKGLCLCKDESQEEENFIRNL